MEDNRCGCWPHILPDESMAIRSKEIDRMLYEDRFRSTEVKLLVLGASESGKTTFIKQMRIINGEGFSEDERRGYTKLVFQNIFQSMRAMTDAMKTLKIPYANPQNEIYAEWFERQDVYQITQLQRSFIEAIRYLWADQGFEMCYSRRGEYQLLDSTE